MDTINTSQNVIKLFDYIKETVNDGKYSHTTGWLACKCPYCDGSSNKRHLSIQLKEGSPLIYKCFRASCGVSGVLNKKISRDLGLIDPIFLKHIQNSYNDNILIDASKKGIIKKVNSIELGNLDDDIKEYFMKRTGKELTIDLQDKFRIFGSINEFIKNNNNKRFNNSFLSYRAMKETKENNKCIHFLNHTNTMMYGRSINGDDKIKSSLVVVNNSLGMHMPYMFVSEGQDLFEGNENNLFIGEGIFDVINGYFHLYNNYKGIFMASTSFVSTANLINFFTKNVYKPNIIILSDDDVDLKIYKMKILKKLNKKRIDKIFVVYNKNGKDLGDYEGKPFEIEVIKLYGEKR